MEFNDQTIVIIGASSGIGRSLAQELAKKGATLILAARRESVLNELKETLVGEHHSYGLDVAVEAEVAQFFSYLSNLPKAIDRIILMSALYEPNSYAKMDLQRMSDIVDVNVKGCFYISNYALTLFTQQQSGQIALCASVAGYMGLPHGQPYSATKAAVINLAESLYVESPKYVDVKLINPGFVRTPMTDKNDFTMPLITTADKAATAVMRGLNKKGFEIAFPKLFTLWIKLIAHLPYFIQLWLTKKLKR